MVSLLGTQDSMLSMIENLSHVPGGANKPSESATAEDLSHSVTLEYISGLEGKSAGHDR